jgi:hypothetical protein
MPLPLTQSILLPLRPHARPQQAPSSTHPPSAFATSPLPPMADGHEGSDGRASSIAHASLPLSPTQGQRIDDQRRSICPTGLLPASAATSTSCAQIWRTQLPPRQRPLPLPAAAELHVRDAAQRGAARVRDVAPRLQAYAPPYLSSVSGSTLLPGRCHRHAAASPDRRRRLVDATVTQPHLRVDAATKSLVLRPPASGEAALPLPCSCRRGGARPSEEQGLL